MAGLVASGTARYAVTGLLGEGGMGSVYAALDLRTQAKVALKRLRANAREGPHRSRVVELFHQEFRTLAQLAHPHVVQVHDFGSDEQGPYYTMELLEGESLHALAPLPWREVCALVRDVCSALALLHSRRLLHRDLSPKNIQRTDDGRAKLIDFGAMTLMGPTKNVVGTAPLVPPEALLQQPLDGRADLYALGGTLYYALTGMHAYPARQMAELRSVWRTPPRPPSTHVPDVPPELDRLVLSLLSLEPVARPSSAAEVLDRLAAIAALPRDEQPAVTRAYLSTPELVGRSSELGRIRAMLVDLHGGRRHVLAIEGAPGTGRSRMLGTCVLEAKLAGMTVVRADTADAGAGAYGAAGALVRQLWDTLEPDEQGLLDCDELAMLRGGTVDAALDAARRAGLQAALQTLVWAYARRQPLLLAIDDFERCDEPSQAAFAAAAAVAAGSARVMFAFSCEAAATAEPLAALSLLRQHAVRMQLSVFAPADTQALLASMFGDVPNLHGVAERVHELAEGNPRDCVELAQYLVDHDLVSYEMGRWQLPAALDEQRLPATLSQARLAKLDALSPDARELCTALALADGSGLDLDAYPALTSHGDPARVHGALDELLLAQVLRIESGTYVFEARALSRELARTASEPVRAAACGRVADALEQRGRDRLDIARYRWRAEQPARAIDTLLAELEASGTRWQRAPHDYAGLLRACMSACEPLGRPRRDRLLLLRELVRVGQDLGLPDLREQLIAMFAEASRDSGLDQWDPRTAPAEPQALFLHVVGPAQQRYDAADAHERGLSPLEAVIMLSRLAAETCAIAAQTADVELFDVLPVLVPFFPLSRAISRVQDQTIPACRAVVAARYEDAHAIYVQSLSELLNGNDAGVDGELRTWGIHALQYALGCIEGGWGRPQALEYARALEQAPGWLVPAYSVLQIYHLTLGNLREAERYRRSIELSLLQSPVKPPLSAGAVHQHLFVFALADNPNGMRQAIPELEALAHAHPTLREFVVFARAEHARICGDYEEALRELDSLRSRVKAGTHPLWPWVTGSRLTSLLGLHRYEDVRALAAEAVEVGARAGVQVMRDHAEVPLALAEAKLGAFDSACARMARIIGRRTELGMEGVVLGWVHEARAQIALWMGDFATFDHHAQQCALQYKKSGGESALAAKYDRLIQEARRYGASLRPVVEDAMAITHTTLDRTADADTEGARRIVASELSACDSRPRRAQRALELLVGNADALAGELFLLGPDGLTKVHSSCEGLGGDALQPALARMLEVDDGALDDRTVLTAPLALRGTLPDGSNTSVWPMLLCCARPDGTAVAGVIALHFHESAPVRLPLEIATAAAEVLISTGDARPHLVGGLGTTTPRT